MSWGRAYGVWGCILGAIVITGLLMTPSYILNWMDDFAIKPFVYAGLDYKRAGIVSICMALLASLFIIGHTVLMFLSPTITPMTAGYVLLICFMSVLFSNMYMMDIESTQSRIQREYNETGEVMLGRSVGRFDTWEFHKEDWGPYYEPCQSISGTKLHHCIGDAFDSKSREFSRKYKLVGYCHLGFACCFILYLVNPKPLKTIGVFVVMFVLMSLWVLPIYMSALKTRSPSKIALDECVKDPYVTMILAFAWCTAITSIAIIAFSIFEKMHGAVVASIGFVAFDIALVVYMYKLSKDGDIGNCGPFHNREMEVLPLLGVPQYIVTGIVGLAAVAMLCMCLCSGGDTEKAQSVMVIYRVEYIIRAS